MSSTIAAGGVGTLGGLARVMITPWAAELLILFVVLGGGLVAFRVPLRRFVQHVREPFVIAFATTSSAAALPLTLENL
jgi:proton glutamate symport protein